MISVQQLACERAERVVLRHVSFAVSGHELLLVTGANGSGKTTLLRILAGLASYQSGTVSIAANTLRLYIGHSNGIKSALSARDNCHLMCRLSDHTPLCSIDEALHCLALHLVADRPCYTLSAGQQRRVALTRLLLLPGHIWVLDEPLTALDVEGRAIFSTLLRAHLERGNCVIMSTHQHDQFTDLACSIKTLYLKQHDEAILPYYQS